MNFKCDKSITNIKFINENKIKEFKYWSNVYEYSDREGVYLVIIYNVEDNTFDDLQDEQTIYIEKDVYVGQDNNLEKQVYKYSDMNLMIRCKQNSCDEITTSYCVFSNNNSLQNSYRILKSLL